MGKYKRMVLKLQKPLAGDNMVLGHNKDRNFIFQYPMDEKLENLFNGRIKIYCRCKYRKNDNWLFIGDEIDANW